MSGTEKLPLLVIGKSANPRCFKNKEVPVAYKANKKAWMTAQLFETWLKEWDRKLKRKVMLYLDNFSGHPKIKLQNITIKFLPPNTTAASQPCDQGIIQNLKVHYRRYLLRERIAAIDNMTGYKIDLLKSLQFLRKAWADIKKETIANCFRKAGFVKNVEARQEGIDEVQTEGGVDDEMNILWAELQALALVEGDLNDVDDKLATGGMRSLAEIAADVSTRKMEEPEVDSDPDLLEIDEEPELPPVTAQEAHAALKILQRYVETKVSDPSMLQFCDKMDDLLAKERVKRLKQKNLLEYFTH